jgi:hypothetical protein
MSTRSPATSSQSASGDYSRRTQSSVSRDPGGPIVAATTVSFTAPDTISDSGNGFQFAVGDPVEVRGSALNSRRFVVVTAAAGAITVAPTVVQDEAAGPAIIVLRDDE